MRETCPAAPVEVRLLVLVLVGPVDVDVLVGLVLVEVLELVGPVDVVVLVGAVDVVVLVGAVDVDVLVGEVDVDVLVGEVDVDVLVLVGEVDVDVLVEVGLVELLVVVVLVVVLVIVVVLVELVGGGAAGVMFVWMVVEHVTTLPPGLPVPLHWLTRIGIAALMVDGGTVQWTVPPPPLPEPLHWVTVAPVVVAGKGSQLTVPPPPVAEPTHWLTVAAVTGLAPGVSALMLLVIDTRQVIGWAASLSEALHWVTLVTRLVERLTKVPLEPPHGSLAHRRVTVVTDPLVAPLMVLTTVTEHCITVVAPPGPGPMPLHWFTSSTAACADWGEARAARKNPAVSSISAASEARHARGNRRTLGGARVRSHQSLDLHRQERTQTNEYGLRATYDSPTTAKGCKLVQESSRDRRSGVARPASPLSAARRRRGASDRSAAADRPAGWRQRGGGRSRPTRRCARARPDQATGGRLACGSRTLRLPGRG